MGAGLRGQTGPELSRAVLQSGTVQYGKDIASVTGMSLWRLEVNKMAVIDLSCI
jgi:hypothetical protein